MGSAVNKEAKTVVIRISQKISGTDTYTKVFGDKTFKINVGKVVGVKASRNGYSSNKITWSPVSGVKEYVVWRSTSKNCMHEGVKTLTSTNYVDSGLITSKTIYFLLLDYK